MEEKLAGQFELGEPDGQAVRLEYEAALAGHLRIAGKPSGQAGTFAQGAFPPCIHWRQHQLYRVAFWLWPQVEIIPYILILNRLGATVR